MWTQEQTHVIIHKGKHASCVYIVQKGFNDNSQVPEDTIVVEEEYTDIQERPSEYTENPEESLLLTVILNVLLVIELVFWIERVVITWAEMLL